MRYVCFVYTNPDAFAKLSQEELDELDDANLAHDAELDARGQLVMAQALQPVDTATTIRVRDGRMSATDGPFAETTEQLGGFVYIEARDLNEAIAIAGKMPMARLGSIEVRPVLDLVQRVRDRQAR